MTKKVEEKKDSLGVGLDCGTMNFVAARYDGGKAKTRRMRDVFLDLDVSTKKMLRMGKISFVERKEEEDVIVLGDAALEIASSFAKEVRRPLKAGLISPNEADSLNILGLLISSVLGEPREPGEVCYFSVPAAPIDVNRDVVYHTGVLDRIIRECGYEPYDANEAMGIIYSEAAEDKFSGIGVSFGCLTPSTRVITRDGAIPISEITEGQEVLSRTGRFNRVLKTWSRPHEGPVYHVTLYGNPEGVTLTGNHKVWVQRGGEWGWVAAETLQKGDVIGEPCISGAGRRLQLPVKDRDRNGPLRQRVLDWSFRLGRFLGYFLADGHLSRADKNREGRYEIWIDFGPDEDEYVEDLTNIAQDLLKRSVSISPHGNAKRCHFSHRGLHIWLSRNCYKDSTKRFPLRLEDLKPNVVEGLVVGLVRGDGWLSKDGVRFGNSNIDLITTFHLLIGKMGLTSTVTKRPPRNTELSDGRVIEGEQDEWTVHVTGQDGEILRRIIEEGNSERSVKVWRDGGFRCTRIRDIQEQSYEGKVLDLTVENDPSFVSFGITLHNSGMTNVALAVNAVAAGMEFSVARAGDWIDEGAANSLGVTTARMCSIKENGGAGINLMDWKTREEEAIVFYYRALIDYVLKKVAEQFRLRCQLAIARPIPIIVSGGTSLAGGFMELFEEQFKRHRRRFPVEISEIRHAKKPLEAVARGLLLQAVQEYQEE